MKHFARYLTLTALLASCSHVQSVKIISRYYAKSLCTCLFVSEHPLDYCKKSWRSKEVPNYSLDINWNQKIVETSVLTFTGKAHWQDSESGCYLAN